MSKIWHHVSREHPCPICKKEDWCQFGDRAMKCMRVDSQHACPSGGWYHFYESERPSYVPRFEKKAPAPSIDAESLMKEWRGKTTMVQFFLLSTSLGVRIEAIIAMGAAWAKEYRAWAFPMRNEFGATIGIRLRNDKGFKWAVEGSRQGIFLPEPSVKLQPCAYLPEGPTDTAALLSLGLFAIGRPTCNAGNDLIKRAMERLKIFKAVVVADNDEMKRLGSKEGRPGIDGALKLKKDLRLPSVIWIPPSPVKDVREFYRKGGSRELIESDVKNKIWSKY